MCVADVQCIASELTHHQKIGLRHFEDFEKRIPRSEMVALESRVLEAVRQVSPELQACAAGSYRRGASQSGDIDVLIMDSRRKQEGGSPFKAGDIRGSFMKSPRKHDTTVAVLSDVVKHLKTCGLVTDDISLGARQYHGVVRLDGSSCFRRLDLLLFPPEDYACALLHFTGSGGFNRHMRAHALEKGFTLNEKGLHRGTAEDKGERISVSSEREVFEAIGLDWRTPEDREMGK